MLSVARLTIMVVSVVLVMVSAVIHELAHAYCAYKLGDATAKERGRLTLNPAAHLDPFGSFILPLIMAIMGGPIFAFAKPVPYNPYRLKHRPIDEVLVALAGPFSNLLQAGVAAIVYNALPTSIFAGHLELGAMVFTVLSIYMQVNVYLLFFNLIPLPPLDGSKIVYLFLNDSNRRTYDMIQHYSMAILLVVLYVLPTYLNIDILSVYFSFTADKLLSLLMGIA